MHTFQLQQCLPLAVLKPNNLEASFQVNICIVATVLTACGIETDCRSEPRQVRFRVATVLTACGIETILAFNISPADEVATVLTACGIET